MVNRLPIIDDDAYVQVESQNDSLTVEEATNKVFEQYGMPKLGGASGKGWSYYSTMQKCWYLYKKKYVDETNRGRPGKALEVGSFLHTLLAVYYSGFITDGYPLSPEAL